MNRRTFILGAGAAAAGGASLIGSGAFTSVEADRAVNVETAGDADALLRLAPCVIDGEEAPNGAYADTNPDGTFRLDITAGSNAAGVNIDALSRFRNVFEVCNNGSQPICLDFQVDVKEIPGPVPDRHDFDAGDPAIVFYRNGNEDEPLNVDELDVDRPGAVSLAVGDCQCFGFNVRSYGFDSAESVFEDAELEIEAKAGAGCVETVTDGDAEGDLPGQGLVAWYDADELSLAEGNAVETWPDKSGDPVNDAEQPNSDRQPEFVTDAIGGKPALRFGGSSDRLLASEFSAGDSDEVTLFVVAQYSALPSANPGLIHAAPEGSAFSSSPADKSVGLWVSDDDDTWGRLIQEDGTSRNFPRDPGLDSETGYVFTQRADGDDEGQQWVDSDPAGTVSYDGTLQEWSEFGIGRQGSETWEGDIAEVLVYDRALTDTERQNVEEYLADKYGIAL